MDPLLLQGNDPGQPTLPCGHLSPRAILHSPHSHHLSFAHLAHHPSPSKNGRMSHFTVLYFASAKDAAKTESERLEWSSGLRASSLTTLLVQRHPELEQVLKTCMFAVNMEYMDQDQSWTVQPGDEVAVIPPVSGG